MGALSAKEEANVVAFLKELADGKTCPHCHVEVKERKQYGRCLYAYPCGHRLGQVGRGKR